MVKAQLNSTIYYLQNNEWSLSKSKLGLEEIFIASKLFGKQTAILFIPTSSLFADFDLRLNDVVRTLSQIENISEKAMVDKINASDDTASDFLIQNIIASKAIEIATH